MKTHKTTLIGIFVVLALMMLHLVAAVDFNQSISAEDKAKFDQILAPVLKIYNLVKYTASVIAVIVLLFAGTTYMTSGSEPGKRDKAKNMAMYVVLGLLVIWAAPLVVNFIVG